MRFAGRAMPGGMEAGFRPQLEVVSRRGPILAGALSKCRGPQMAFLVASDNWPRRPTPWWAATPRGSGLFKKGGGKNGRKAAISVSSPRSKSHKNYLGPNSGAAGGRLARHCGRPHRIPIALGSPACGGGRAEPRPGGGPMGFVFLAKRIRRTNIDPLGGRL